MTKYLLETDDDRWLAFKLVATKRGLKIKDAIVEALDLYINEYADEDLKIEIIRAEKQRDLRAIIDETETIRIVRQLIERSDKTYDPFKEDLKQQLFQKLKKGIVITNRMAEELEKYVKAYKDELPPRIVESITQLIQQKMKT